MEKKPFLTEAMAQEIIQDVPRLSMSTTKRASGKMPAASTRRSAGTRASRSILPSRPCPTPSSCKFCRKRLRRGLLVPDRADAQRVCGFTGSDIMFSSNQTPVEDMQKAYELGAYINLDDAPWWTSWTGWPVCRRRCSAATIRAAPSAWARAKRASR